MRKTLVLLAVSISCCALNAQGPAPVTPTCLTIEVSIVADKPGSGRNVPTDKGGLISLMEKPLLTIDDFTDANVAVTEGQIVLNLNMTTDSAKRVQAFTAEHVGKAMAFLVDGRVINVPRIVDPITGKGFAIGPVRRDEAQKLANSINHRESGCEVQLQHREPERD